MTEQKRKVLWLLKLQEQLEDLVGVSRCSIHLDEGNKVIPKLMDALYETQRLTVKACKEVK